MNGDQVDEEDAMDSGYQKPPVLGVSGNSIELQSDPVLSLTDSI
jgi:hypothetical protein